LLGECLRHQESLCRGESDQKNKANFEHLSDLELTGRDVKSPEAAMSMRDKRA
jgi:hypothetical protein